jgi:hypothetical protein
MKSRDFSCLTVEKYLAHACQEHDRYEVALSVPVSHKSHLSLPRLNMVTRVVCPPRGKEARFRIGVADGVERGASCRGVSNMVTVFSLS